MVVADPERDSVSIVDLMGVKLRHTIALDPGDEPGRSVEDAKGQVHVALRRGGAVLTVDPVAGTVVRRTSTCKAPRGLAFDSLTNLVHVACEEGKLVSIESETGKITRTLTLEPDLRDVIVRGGELWVTRLKSAQVLRLKSDGAVIHASRRQSRAAS